jgi:hypothetical protein
MESAVTQGASFEEVKDEIRQQVRYAPHFI